MWTIPLEASFPWTLRLPIPRGLLAAFFLLRGSRAKGAPKCKLHHFDSNAKWKQLLKKTLLPLGLGYAEQCHGIQEENRIIAQVNTISEYSWAAALPIADRPPPVLPYCPRFTTLTRRPAKPDWLQVLLPSHGAQRWAHARQNSSTTRVITSARGLLKPLSLIPPRTRMSSFCNHFLMKKTWDCFYIYITRGMITFCSQIQPSFLSKTQQKWHFLFLTSLFPSRYFKDTSERKKAQSMYTLSSLQHLPISSMRGMCHYSMYQLKKKKSLTVLMLKVINRFK